METLLQDLRYGIRSLIRTPGFTVAAVLTLALGISATTVVFSLINSILLRPIPAEQPERLFMLNDQTEGGRMTMNGYTAVPPARLDAYVEASSGMVLDMAGVRFQDMALRTEAGAEMIDVVVATPSYFDVLGIRPTVGRLLSRAEDSAGEPTVVLAHRTWQDRYAGDPSVIGSTIHLNGHPHTVVGVAPEGFRGTTIGASTEAWVPHEAYRRLHPGGRGDFEGGDVFVMGFGRLAPGVERSTAEAALAAAAPNIPFPNEEVTITTTELLPVSLVPVGSRGQLLAFVAMFFVTALLVLLIAATNVTGMLLARATGRAREIAIRVAVGADRRRIVRQLVTEGVLLFVVGAVAALLLTYWVTAALPTILPDGGSGDSQALAGIRPDARVLGFGLLLAFLSGLAFTIVPAIQVSRTELVPALKDGTSGSGSRRMRLRTGFVVTQVATSFVLLIVAGLFVRTLREALHGDLGFEPAGIAVARLNPATQGYDEEGGRQLFDALAARVASMPGVESVAMVMFPPMGGFVLNGNITPAEHAGDEDAGILTDFAVVGPGYLSTMRIPLRAGRDFTSMDREGAPPVAIVNEAFAEAAWPGQNPIGRQIASARHPAAPPNPAEDAPITVVGVAATAKYRDMRDDRIPVMYRPYTQVRPEAYTLVARSEGDPAILLPAIREALGELDPDLALLQPMPLTAMIARTLFPQRFAATLIGAFGFIGLLLAAIGLYGVLAYHVGQRTREIGIRIALGARARAVVAMVMRQGALLAGIGIAAGVVVAVAATRLLRSMLVGVSATDALTFAVVCVLLGAVALAASWFPARRATRVDPTIALRSE